MTEEQIQSVANRAAEHAVKRAFDDGHLCRFGEEPKEHSADHEWVRGKRKVDTEISKVWWTVVGIGAASFFGWLGWELKEFVVHMLKKTITGG